MNQRNAIALMITLFFIIAISAVLGFSLKYLNKATSKVQNDSFILQTRVVLDDVLNILKRSADLDAIVQENSKDALFALLSEASFIPFESSGIKVIIELKSARAMLNVNTLVDNNGTVNINRAQALEGYLTNYYNVNGDYINMLVDSMSRIKEDMSYNSAIFDEKPYLFRDYIASKKHLAEINDFYAKSYNENSLSKIDFDKLFYYSKERDSLIDVNYANAETWRLLIGCDEGRAEELSSGAGSYATLQDLGLSEEETEALNSFDISYYEPYLYVSVNVSQGSMDANIHFEYDMKEKKGSNFVYEI